MPKSKLVRRGNESAALTDESSLNRAFTLAHSLYRHDESYRKIALNIVSEALRAVRINLTAQVEADRHGPLKPSKVRWSTSQLFQILIFCKSEAYEIQQEAETDVVLSQEDMIIRYLKHLILTTSRRNSFHVSLGMSRLLYDYTAAQAIAIYDFVFQDPDSSTRKADAYYRARKSKLLEELERRFHRFVRIVEGPRGERGFQLQPDSTMFNDLVVEYLTRFTPWDTICELPKHVDTWADLSSLQSSQAKQIHALIHPQCFSRITDALKLDSPENRLALPRFFFIKSPSSDSSRQSNLREREIADIRRRLRKEEKQRKRFIPDGLSVLVDGNELGRLEFAESTHLRCELETAATLIEIIGHAKNNECLLATHVITKDDDESLSTQPNAYSILLEGGQKISLTMTTEASRSRFLSAVDINYEETKAVRALMLWTRRFLYRIANATKLERWRVASARSFGFVATVTALIGAFVLYLAFRNGSDERVAKLQPTPSPVESQSIPQPSPQTSAVSVPTDSPVTKPEPSIRGAQPKSGITTREQTERSTKSLADVHRVYFESLGEDSFSRSVREKLIEKLRAIPQIEIVYSADTADTELTGSVQSAGQETMSNGQKTEVGNAELRLINVSGEVLWRSKTYRGTAGRVSDQFAKDLLAAIETEKRRTNK